jgi:hypothetical protein
MTAVELHDKRPWLYRMIMMAASSHEKHRQIETGKLLMSELSNAVSLFLALKLSFLGIILETASH